MATSVTRNRTAPAPEASETAPPAERRQRSRRWIAALQLWHGFVAAGLVLFAAATVLTEAGPDDALPTFGLLAAVALLLACNVAAVPLLRARRFSGRALSLLTNYLGLLGSAALWLQTTGVFVGVDALGDTFRRGLPFLGLWLVGYLIAGWRTAPEQRATTRRIVRIISIVAAVGFFLVVGGPAAVWTVAQRTVDLQAATFLVLAIVFGVFATVAWRDEMAYEFGTTHDQTETLAGLLLVSPNVLGFVTFFAGPLLFSLFVSLNSWDAFGPKVWVGLDNYIQLFSLDFAWGANPTFDPGYFEFTSIGPLAIGARDTLFWISMRNIILFSLLAIPLAVGPALVLAVLLNSKQPGMKVFRALYFIPTVAGVVGVTLIWKQLLNATVGFVNFLISRAIDAVNVLPSVAIADPRLQWLSDTDLALFSLVIVFAFQYIGYNAVLFLAGLQGVRGDLYEAAHIDGANAWQRFRNITIPQLAPTTFFVVATTGILALQLFTESVVLFANFTPPGSGPNNAALTPVAYLYQEGFQRFSQGYASAIAWVLFLFIFAFTFIQFQRQRAQVEEA